MTQPPIDLAPLRRALAMLDEAILFWHQQAAGSALKPHLRSAVIQSFEYSYELSVRSLRRVLVERAQSAERVTDLGFNDLLRAGADAGFPVDPLRWRQWREMRNATSHAYDEKTAQSVASEAAAFAREARMLLDGLEASVGR
jgi:nucleotidyltransferase substrate binding protein (TIGR01987 family)